MLRHLSPLVAICIFAVLFLPGAAVAQDAGVSAREKPGKVEAPPPGYSRDLEPRNIEIWGRRIAQDYPARALREGMQGVVSVRLLVGGNGRGVACTVSRSSGFEILDERACQNMMRYARFEPALDLFGRPKMAYWSMRLRYAL